MLVACGIKGFVPLLGPIIRWRAWAEGLAALWGRKHCALVGCHALLLLWGREALIA